MQAPFAACVAYQSERKPIDLGRDPTPELFDQSSASSASVRATPVAVI